jgi:hypothetical protein
MEEITTKEATMVIEVEANKVVVQQFIAGWKNKQQA